MSQRKDIHKVLIIGSSKHPAIGVKYKYAASFSIFFGWL